MTGLGLAPVMPHRSTGRASLSLLIMGTLALLIGGGFLIASFAGDATLQTPEMQRLMSQLGIDSPEILRVLLRISGGLFIAYAVGAIAFGIIVRRGTLPWLILAAVLAGVVVCFIVLTIVLSLIDNQTDVVVPIIVCGLHVLVIVWLIDAIRDRITNTTPVARQDTHHPLAAYYATLPNIVAPGSY